MEFCKRTVNVRFLIMNNIHTYTHIICVCMILSFGQCSVMNDNIENKRINETSIIVIVDV